MCPSYECGMVLHNLEAVIERGNLPTAGYENVTQDDLFLSF